MERMVKDMLENFISKAEVTIKEALQHANSVEDRKQNNGNFKCRILYGTVYGIHGYDRKHGLTSMSEIKKSIPDEVENILDNLANRAKDSWNLARKIIEYMEG